MPRARVCYKWGFFFLTLLTQSNNSQLFQWKDTSYSGTSPTITVVILLVFMEWQNLSILKDLWNSCPKFSQILPPPSPSFSQVRSLWPSRFMLCVFLRVAVSVEMLAGFSVPTIMPYFHKCTTVVKIGCRKKAGQWQFSTQVTIYRYAFISQIFLWETESAPMIPTPTLVLLQFYYSFYFHKYH